PDGRVQPRPDLDTAVVRLDGATVGTAEIAAVHVDLAGAVDLVKDAVEVVDRADLGDEDAELTVGDALDVDLAWYEAGGLPSLLTQLEEGGRTRAVHRPDAGTAQMDCVPWSTAWRIGPGDPAGLLTYATVGS